MGSATNSCCRRGRVPYRHTILAALQLATLLLAACSGGGASTAGGGGSGGGEDVPPAGLQYADNPVTYPMQSAIRANAPMLASGTATSFSVVPDLPAGLQMQPSSGMISGTPTEMRAAASYTITASNGAGSTARELVIHVADALPVVSYGGASVSIVGGTAMPTLTPTSTGGAVTLWTIAPSLPAGIDLDNDTGVVSGSPTAVRALTTYTVTASNDGGVATATFSLAVTAPPLTITTQPNGTTIAAGATADFTVAADGTGALSFQWLRNGTPIGGANGSSYTTPAAVGTDDGALYSAAVSDTWGSTVESARGMLSVVGGSSAATTALPAARGRHTQTTLGDGSVLLVGGQSGSASGYYASAVRFVPGSASFAATAGDLAAPRSEHRAVRLGDGRVLVTGDVAATTGAERFDRATGTFAATAGATNVARRGHTATALRDGRVLLAGGDDAGDLASAELHDLANDTFAATGSMATARSDHAAALLPDGTVLVAGGGATPTATAERYDPDAGTWAATGAMATARSLHFAVALADGRVLVGGGTDGAATLASTELYDPGTGAFSSAGDLATARTRATARRLANGRVLVLGGTDGAGAALASCEVFDPASGAWFSIGDLVTARARLDAAPIPDGRLLIAGGEDGAASMLTDCELFDPQYPGHGQFVVTDDPSTVRTRPATALLHDGRVLMAGGTVSLFVGSNTAEIYDPATATWNATGNLVAGRSAGMATTLADGTVLLCGGSNVLFPLATAELFDPAAGTFAATASMSTARLDATASLLPDGRVLVAGGSGGSGVLQSAEVYDRAAASWTATGNLVTARREHVAVPLSDGRVLVAGGVDGSGQVLTSCELFDPDSATWSATGSMATARNRATATRLADGRVLVVGGGTLFVAIASAEIFDPDTGTWSTTGSLQEGRGAPGSALLPDGRVLVLGGMGPTLQSLTTAELFDPGTGAFTATGSAATGRQHPGVLLLPGTGRVLVIGGSARAELYR